MKKVYLIHGWGGFGSGGWFDWLKQEFKKRNIQVSAFDMPDTDYPKIETWIKFLKENIKGIDNETFFIGHSIGCQTILRFLQSLPENVKIGGCVFVAGWFNLKKESYKDHKEREIAEPWLKTPINTKKIRSHCSNFLSIFSDNDFYVPLSDSDIFKKELNSKIIIKKNQGHFDSIKEIPEIIKFIEKSL